MDSRTAHWMIGYIVLSTAGEIYTLGYIYYIPFDPEAGAGFVVDNQKKRGRQTRQQSWVLILQLLWQRPFHSLKWNCERSIIYSNVFFVIMRIRYFCHHFTVSHGDWELKSLSQGHTAVRVKLVGEPSSIWSQSLWYMAWTKIWDQVPY